MTASTLYIGNSARLTLAGLRGSDGELVEGATVSLSALTDYEGDDVEGIDLPIALTETEAGMYAGDLPADISGLVAEHTYFATIDVTAGLTTGRWTEAVEVRRRMV